MYNTMIAGIVGVIMLVAVFAGLVWFQIYLSKKPQRWPGLVFPSLCFVYSIIAVLSMTAFTTITQESVNTVNEETGEVVEEVMEDQKTPEISIGDRIVAVIPVFLITNIQTILYLVIYFSCRKKINAKEQLGKMNIQDLE